VESEDGNGEDEMVISEVSSPMCSEQESCHDSDSEVDQETALE
jgi:hypothetical protein